LISLPYNSYQSTKNKLHCLDLAGFHPEKTTMQEVFDHYRLDANTASFTGHALALYLNDE